MPNLEFAGRHEVGADAGRLAKKSVSLDVIQFVPHCVDNAGNVSSLERSKLDGWGLGR